jgi:hypothetical protein
MKKGLIAPGAPVKVIRLPIPGEVAHESGMMSPPDPI